MDETFVTTSRGLRRDSPPMRLFEKAKKLGIWNPSDIDFSQDIVDWQTLAPDEKDILLRLTAMFQAGEEAVTVELLPLIMTVAEDGRLEEELFLTTFLFEEAKHTDFFHRFLSEVVQLEDFDLAHYHTENYKTIFYEALPNTLRQLRTDNSSAQLARASVIYNMIVEGMLAETGYHAYFTVLERNNILSGTQKGIHLLKQDESRHIAYGIYLLSRLIAEDGNNWDVIEESMNELLMPAISVISDVFEQYDPVPFGLVEDDFVDYAMNQFQKRNDRLEHAREATLAEIDHITHRVIEADDG